VIGLHPFPQADSESRENWRVTSEVLDKLYLEFFLEPGDGGLYGGAALAATGGNIANAGNFPDAAVSFWIVNLPIRPAFQRYAYQVDVDYTSTAGGVANFNLQTALWLTTPGGNLGTDPVLAANGTAAGPANANDEKRVTFTSGTATLISPLYRHMRFRFLRDGVADPNNNPLRVLGIYLRLFGV